jgi:hypothetical protein
MKAIGYDHSHPIDHPDALIDIDLPEPVAYGRDLLVDVHAISVNPVDTKIRRGAEPEAGAAKVLGWHQQRAPSGRRAHRWPRASEHQPDRCCGAAIDVDHSLGIAIRALADFTRQGGKRRHAIDHRRRWRRRLDHGATGKTADQLDRHRYRIAP